MKSYTDLKQSKKLVKILLPETADMWYHGHGSHLESDRTYDDEPAAYHSRFPNWDIPCWSLSALLNVLPQTVRLVGTPKDSYWYCECVNANNQWYAGFESASSPVDAAYKMIIKLKELNLL